MMSTTLLGWSRRGRVQSLSSAFSQCRLVRFVYQESVVLSLFSSKVAHCIQNYKYNTHNISRHYSSSSFRSARCKECGLGACFEWEHDGEAICCSFHKEPDMVDVVHRRCEHPGCDIQPHFGHVQKKPVRCASHKLPGMIDVIHRRCEYEGCDSVNPSFDVPGGRGRFCDKHKQHDMIDVMHRKCGHEGCDLHPQFGYLLTGGRWWSNLKLLGMKLQRRRKCKAWCKKRARFGEVLREPLYCAEHKLPQMTDVVSNRCSEHKLEGMVDLYKRCVEKGCKDRAFFGVPGSSFQYCESHKLEGMIQYRGK